MTATETPTPRAPHRRALRPSREPILVRLASTGDAEAGGEAARVRDVRLDALWLEDQPREIVPDEALQQLIEGGRAQPPALLALLQEHATADPHGAEVLAKIQELARSIASEGVLEPIQVVLRGGRLVVLDGHRRCLASLLAGRDAVPAYQVEEASELKTTARALIVNVQREDLTALEKSRALLRLALLVGQELAREEAIGEPVSAEALVGGAVPDDDRDDDPESAGRYARAAVAAVRDRVIGMVGIPRPTYYRLLALNRLSADARRVGQHLPEGQLRPVAQLPPEHQAAILEFAVRQGLAGKEVARLVDVCRTQGRDAVERVMARMRHEQRAQQAARRRPLASWHALFNAVPADVHARAQSLRVELRTVPETQRLVRLRELWEQDRLLNCLRAELADIFGEHGYAGPAEVEEPAEGSRGSS